MQGEGGIESICLFPFIFDEAPELNEWSRVVLSVSMRKEFRHRIFGNKWFWFYLFFLLFIYVGLYLPILVSGDKKIMECNSATSNIVMYFCGSSDYRRAAN